MNFVNEEIDVSQLPKVETLEIQKLESSYMQVAIFSNLIFFFLLLAGFIVIFLISNSFQVNTVFWSILGVILLMTGITTLIRYLGFKIKGYAVRERDIHYRQGLLFRSMTSIPYNRIQHCEVSEGFLDRMFDLGKLKIYTAGGSNSDLVIPGLLATTAHELRAMILARTTEKNIPSIASITTHQYFEHEEE